MNKLTMLLLGAVIALVVTALLYLAFHELWITFIGVAGVAVVLLLVGRRIFARRKVVDGLTVGVGTVCTAGNDESPAAAGYCQILIEVASVHGDTFIGRLIHRDGDPDMSMLRPGLVVLVAFDPTAREQLSLPDDMLAVRATFVDPI